MSGEPSADIKALIALVEDPDPEVYELVRDKILNLGPLAIPLLEEEWEHQADIEVQRNIENLIHAIQIQSVHTELRNWYLKGATDPVEGSLIVAKYQYPKLDAKALTSRIDSLTDLIGPEISQSLSPMEKVKAINHVLYDIHGFRGNKHDYHAPQNSYLNDVLSTKKGNPLTLGIIYARVAQKIGLPVFGVNLPEHFILAYLDESKYRNREKRAPVLFYINAFNRGAIFRRVEVELFIRQMKLEPRDEYFVPCKNEQVILRMLHNLELAYQRTDESSKAMEIRSLKTALGVES